MNWREAIRVSNLTHAKDIKVGSRIYDTNLRIWRTVERVLVIGMKRAYVTVDGIEVSYDPYDNVRVHKEQTA